MRPLEIAGRSVKCVDECLDKIMTVGTLALQPRPWSARKLLGCRASTPGAVERRGGFAVPVVLALLVVLLVAVLSLFSVSQNDLASSRGYANGIQARLLTDLAAEEILSDLQSEIAGYEALRRAGWQANATVLGTGVLPAQVLPGLSSNQTARNAHPLIRVSHAGASYAAGFASNGLSPPPVNRASPVNTLADPALRGRKVPPARWASTALLPDGITQAIRGPDWIYITRNGSESLTNDDVEAVRKSADLTNQRQVIGRYAYRIYDVSGLLDLNVAGALASADPGTKGGTFFARLEPVLGNATAQSFLQWRDTDASNSSPRLYGSSAGPGAIETGEVGKAGARNNELFARQDLLAMTQGNGVLSTAPGHATQMVRTWSASSPAPGDILVWDEARNARQRLAGNYTTTANLTIPAYNLDGTPGNYTITATATNPASRFTRKFPLGRLRWLGGNDPHLHGAIKQHFGLRRTGSPGISVDEGQSYFPGWVYCSPDGTAPATRIKSLSEITDREPDLFEWLKAAIDPGSLGVAGGNGSAISANSTTALHTKDQNKDLQILRIGANIIDQYDSDDVPTAIISSVTGGGIDAAFGVENLPYINEMIWSLSRDNRGAPLNAWARFELWNPHANAINNPGRLPRDASGGAMTNFRIRFTRGGAHLIAGKFFENVGSGIIGSWINGMNYSRPQFRGVHGNWSDGSRVEPTAFFNLAGMEIAFSLPNLQGGIYQEPALIDGLNETGNETVDIREPASVRRPKFRPGPTPGAGAILLGSLPLPEQPISRTWNGTDGNGTISIPLQSGGSDSRKASEVGDKNFDVAWMHTSGLAEPRGSREPATVVLEVEVDGSWRPYQTIEGFDDSAIYFRVPEAQHAQLSNWNLNQTDTSTFSFYGWGLSDNHNGYLKVDPRTSRWGISLQTGGSAGRSIRTSTAAPPPLTPNRLADLLAWGDGSSKAFPGQERDGTGNQQQPSPLPNWTIARKASPVLTTGLFPFLAANNPASEYYVAEQSFLASSHATSVVRRADYAGVITGADASDFVSIPGSRARPVILNRPFRTVGELGYVFRDTPWKTLDFFFPESGDTGLAEIFSLGGTPVLSGKIQPYAAPPAVVRSLIEGTLRVEEGGDRISPDERDAVVGLFDAGARPAPNLPSLLSHLNNSTATRSSDVPFKLTKTRGEAVARTLVDACDLRTWNLLIDLLVQAGEIPPSADALRSFDVFGEQRSWIHAAIDRITGEVLAIRSEPKRD